MSRTAQVDVTPDLSVVIPVYNEGRTAADVCRQVRETLEESPGDTPPFEIILVDDGSTDGGLAAKPESADVLTRFTTNRGYGAALKRGFERARGRTIVFLDADGTYDPKYIPTLLNHLDDDTEMAVGARTGADVNIPIERRLPKWALRTLANYLAGQRIPDLNSGLRAVRRSALRRYLHLLPEGFSLTTTITLAFLCDARDIAYVPIDYPQRRGKSKIRPLRDTQRILATILRTVTYFNPMKVFAPLSLALAALALLVLILSAAFSDQIMDGAVAVLSISAIQTLGFGMLADVIARGARRRR